MQVATSVARDVYVLYQKLGFEVQQLGIGVPGGRGGTRRVRGESAESLWLLPLNRPLEPSRRHLESRWLNRYLNGVAYVFLLCFAWVCEYELIFCCYLHELLTVTFDLHCNSQCFRKVCCILLVIYIKR